MILALVFNSQTDFQKADCFFKSEITVFIPEYYNEEYNCFGFLTENKDNADLLEKNLNCELLRNGFDNFNFELVEHQI